MRSPKGIEIHTISLQLDTVIALSGKSQRDNDRWSFLYAHIVAVIMNIQTIVAMKRITIVIIGTKDNDCLGRASMGFVEEVSACQDFPVTRNQNIDSTDNFNRISRITWQIPYIP